MRQVHVDSNDMMPGSGFVLCAWTCRWAAGLTLLMVAHAWTQEATFRFPEVWAYLMQGEEAYYPPADAPFTDIGCFSAAVQADGSLKGGHSAPPSLPPGQVPRPRFHLVVSAPWNNDLMHLRLRPDLPMRETLLQEICARVRTFDGVQVDLESVARSDSDLYVAFIQELRRRLPTGKRLSVALLPRWTGKNVGAASDAFDYPAIAASVDRVIVMAYDEHSAGSSPGPVASLAWCRRIATYAAETVPPENLVMGLPLYGRAWQRERYARAYKYRDVLEVAGRRQASVSHDPAEGGRFTYVAEATVQVHFETRFSLAAKLDLYAQTGCIGVAFWRLGQEPYGTWGLVAPAP